MNMFWNLANIPPTTSGTYIVTYVRRPFDDESQTFIKQYGVTAANFDVGQGWTAPNQAWTTFAYPVVYWMSLPEAPECPDGITAVQSVRL